MLVSNVYRGGVGDELTPQIGSRELVEIHIGETPYWEDDFRRDDSLSLGDGWMDGHDLAPDDYERIGVLGGAASISMLSRTLPPQPEYEAGWPPRSGESFPGISFAARDCPDNWLPDIEIIRPGDAWMRQAPSLPPLPDRPAPGSPFVLTGDSYHIESTPLLYIDTDSPITGYGCWPSAWWMGRPENPAPWGMWCGIGRPPEDFGKPHNPIVAGSTWVQNDRSDYSWRIKAVSPGELILIRNDKQLAVIRDDGRGPYDPVSIPAELLGSRRHGFAVDAHLVRPYRSITGSPAVLSIRYHGLGSEDFGT